MSSAVQICNMALSHAGGKGSIASLDERSEEARRCNTWYEPCRRQMLEIYDWNFAKARVSPALHADAPPDAWAFRYQYPASCRRLIRATNPLGDAAPNVPFVVELSSGSPSILCGLEDAEFQYTYDLTDSSLFSSLFENALALLIATVISYPLTAKRELRADAVAALKIAKNEAMTANANESGPALPKEADWISGR